MELFGRPIRLNLYGTIKRRGIYMLAPAHKVGGGVYRHRWDEPDYWQYDLR